MHSLIAAGLVVLTSLLPSNALLQDFASKVKEQAIDVRTASEPRPSMVVADYTALPVAQREIVVAQDSKAAMLYDTTSARVLYQRNANQRLPIASITKVMTAIVILNNHSLDEVMTVPKLPPQPIGSQAMGIKPGEQFKLSEALTGMLTFSANDMADALAIWDSGSTEAFVRKMNDTARSLGLDQTNFVDATGLESSNQYSTANDLTLLASVALNSEFFRFATSQPRYNVTTTNQKTYRVTTTNQLLGTYGVIGTKTGYTLAAGQCLLSLTRRDGREIIGVVLGSSDRFGQTRRLINAVGEAYTWQ